MIPAGMQQFMDSLALTLMFRIVAFVGTVEVAAYSVLVNMIKFLLGRNGGCATH